MQKATTRGITFENTGREARDWRHIGVQDNSRCTNLAGGSSEQCTTHTLGAVHIRLAVWFTGCAILTGVPAVKTCTLTEHIHIRVGLLVWKWTAGDARSIGQFSRSTGCAAAGTRAHTSCTHWITGCAAGLGRVDTRRRASSADGGATGVQGRRYGHQNATDTGHDETRRLVAGAVESRQDGLVHGPGRRNRETVDDHL